VFGKFDHVVILVSDIEAGIRTWAGQIGMTLTHRSENPQVGLAVAFFKFADNTFIELVAPTRDDSPYAEMLRERGEGLRLLSFQVDDLDVAVAELSGRGVALRGGGTDRVFIEPESASGILIQLWPKDRPHRWQALASAVKTD
jgi:methylmalonyl-CoA/ethylmalonyl-CoA epimerase